MERNTDMPNLIKHKRVEFTELFYDLVFVYAISRTTAPSFIIFITVS